MSQSRTFSLDLHIEKDHVWAEVLDLPGCFASGSDMQELAEALAEAIGLVLNDTTFAEARIEPVKAVRTPVPARLELQAC